MNEFMNNNRKKNIWELFQKHFRGTLASKLAYFKGKWYIPFLVVFLNILHTISLRVDVEG